MDLRTIDRRLQKTVSPNLLICPMKNPKAAPQTRIENY
jgi:hypothetical protein